MQYTTYVTTFRVIISRADTTTLMKDCKVFVLVFCVLGLYALFLSWSLLQERINTKPYAVNGTEAVYFKAPLVVNIVQACFASIVGFLYSVVANKQNPLGIFRSGNNNKACEKENANADGAKGKTVGGAVYMAYFGIIALTSSLSSPLGMESLKHVDYLAYLLAKSCKLLPVMLVHFILYQTKFPPYKYLVAGLVTGGVILFTLTHKAKNRTSVNDGNTGLGMAQLLGSMMLDGFTNSTQDQLFKLRGHSQKVTGASLMCILNLFVFILTLSYVVVFKYDTELMYALTFVKQYQGSLGDIVAFAAFGAVGQVFVFIILEKFDSLILVTATVTRKMISMILSVLLFGHHLAPMQWVGVLLVFGGIGFESYMKFPGLKDQKKTKKGKQE